jgi:hypothetical protein
VVAGMEVCIALHDYSTMRYGYVLSAVGLLLLLLSHDRLRRHRCILCSCLGIE